MTEEIADYLNATCDTDPLTDEETRRLVHCTRTGTESERIAARNRLIEANMRLAASRAKRFMHAGVPYRDLIQVAVFGMIRAIELYDDQKARLSTYMAMWIDAGMQRYIDKSSTTIRQPSARRHEAMTLKHARNRLAQRNGRAPTAEELSEETDIDLDEIVRLTNTGAVKSLDESVFSNGSDGEEFGAFIGADAEDLEDEAAVAELWRAIERGVTRLGSECDHRIPYIVKQHYILGRTYEEVGNDLGVSRQRVGQIVERAIAYLRYLCRDDGLAETWQTCDCRLHNRAADCVIELGT